MWLESAPNVRQKKMRYQTETQRRFRTFIVMTLPPEDEEFCQTTAQKLVPPGAYIYRQDEYGRWQMYHDKANRCRSWSEWGYYASFHMLLRWSWKRALEPHGLEVLDCPLKGLFAERTGDPAKDSELCDNEFVIL